MRIGVLTLGAGIETAYLLAPVRAADVDVVTEESPITDALSATKEGGRIARADADIVLLIAAESAAAPFAAVAVLSIGCPLLLAGRFDSAFFEAAGVLAEVGVPFDRLPLTGTTEDSERLLDYLRRHEKRQRQKGIEAAHKLYGQRLALPPTGATPPFDAAQWLRHFGIIAVPTDAPESDFRADDGDAYGALTAHLLHLISGAEPVTVSVGEPLDPTYTYARFARRAGRFVAVALHGDVSPARLVDTLLSGRLHGIPGDHTAAVRAACETLDIPCTVV